ncbi:4-hydroxyphenylacetate 3-hydroxylase N-terminal domain-containing protein [Bradyrhizobium sp. 1]|uniref:4-hydroxyphenylacetate 3-hydroxylase N-terminal domain-containing protein n=1 Tax=Bradyrhizobium sp. 1 TaxID=241591 RepID=UPI001FF73BC1|nr:4-hydroxyphenylacetate 3-hydroxylase N-terminal domain-containing protein [Bradyrhizobium sp. 1]
MDQEIAAGGNAALSGSDPIRAEYIESLRGRNLRVHLMGELVAEPVERPIIRPSINAVAETYDLANASPQLSPPRRR